MNVITCCILFMFFLANMLSFALDVTIIMMYLKTYHVNGAYDMYNILLQSVFILDNTLVTCNYLFHTKEHFRQQQTHPDFRDFADHTSPSERGRSLRSAKLPMTWMQQNLIDRNFKVSSYLAHSDVMINVSTSSERKCNIHSTPQTMLLTSFVLCSRACWLSVL